MRSAQNSIKLRTKTEQKLRCSVLITRYVEVPKSFATHSIKLHRTNKNSIIPGLYLLTCFSGFRILFRSIFVVVFLLSWMLAVVVDVLIAGVAFRNVTFMMVLRFCDGYVGDDGDAGNGDDTIVALLRSTLGMVATKLVVNLWLQSSPSSAMHVAFRLFANINVSNCSRIELAQSFVFFISDVDNGDAAAAAEDVIRLVQARFSPNMRQQASLRLLLLSWLSASIDCSLFALLWFGILAVFDRRSCSSSADLRPPIVHDASLLLLTLLPPSILLPL